MNFALVPVLSQINPTNFNLSYHFKALLYYLYIYSPKRSLHFRFLHQNFVCIFKIHGTNLFFLLLFLQEVCAHQTVIFVGICAYPAYILRTLKTG